MHKYWNTEYGEQFVIGSNFFRIEFQIIKTKNIHGFGWLQRTTKWMRTGAWLTKGNKTVSLWEWTKSNFKRLRWLKQKGYINISISFNLDILLKVYSFLSFFLSFDNNLSFMCSFVWWPHNTTSYNLYKTYIFETSEIRTGAPKQNWIKKRGKKIETAKKINA